MKLLDLPMNDYFRLKDSQEVWQKVVEIPLRKRKLYSFCCVCISGGSAYDRGDSVPILATYEVKKL